MYIDKFNNVIGIIFIMIDKYSRFCIVIASGGFMGKGPVGQF